MRAKENRLSARLALRGHWGISILATLLAGLLGATGNLVSVLFSQENGIMSRAAGMMPANWAQSAQGAMDAFPLAFLRAFSPVIFLYSLAVFIFGSAISLGLKQYYLSLHRRDQPPQVKTIFSKFSIFGKALLLRILTYIFIYLWSLLLIIPGIIAAYRYSMAPYILADNPDIGPMEALRRSKQMMIGHKGRLFWLYLSFIGWTLLAGLTMGIGFIWLEPYREASVADFYLKLAEKQPVQPIVYPLQQQQT